MYCRKYPKLTSNIKDYMIKNDSGKCESQLEKLLKLKSSYFEYIFYIYTLLINTAEYQVNILFNTRIRLNQRCISDTKLYLSRGRVKVMKRAIERR